MKLKKELTVIIERDEDGFFVGSVPELKGCHTQAKSLDELIERIKEAAELCLEVHGEATDSELQFVGVQRITV
jgi:predicted RNase H-like HicB family nuclease